MKVLGMGNALVDIITKLKDDKLLESFGLPKGSMTLVDLDTSNYINVETNGLAKQKASGGSAANTIHGLAHLGIDTGFIGKVGNDNLGNFFRKDMKNNRIHPILYKSISETGRAMALISPDTERTFATYLGAAVELSQDDLDSHSFSDYDLLYLEGYLVQDHELIEKAMRLAKKNDMKICLDLASYNVVEDHKAFFLTMIRDFVDILFANEQEADAITGRQPDEAILQLGKLADIVVIKLGAEGSIAYAHGKKTRIGVKPSEPVDTTGAGDLYAAGFIYGHIRGQSVAVCGKIGSILAGRVIEAEGAKMDESTWESLRREIHHLMEDPT